MTLANLPEAQQARRSRSAASGGAALKAASGDAGGLKFTMRNIQSGIQVDFFVALRIR
jgi:hypothetical protein